MLHGLRGWSSIGMADNFDLWVGHCIISNIHLLIIIRKNKTKQHNINTSIPTLIVVLIVVPIVAVVVVVVLVVSIYYFLGEV